MQLSEAGLRLIKQAEGFRAHAYLDVAGFPTIGYGHRVVAGESFPNGVAEDLAAEMLATDVDAAELALRRLVKVPLAQGQFDSLVDFVFNLGSERLAESTLLKYLNAGQYDSAAEQLLRWDHAAGVENAGLRARREAEFTLWHST